MIFYGLLILWTGLLRGIEAKAYKPNALWFCFAMGFLAILSGFLYRREKEFNATIIGIITFLFVFGFYLYCFITQPDKDATYRVGFAILGSVAALVTILLPEKPLPLLPEE